MNKDDAINIMNGSILHDKRGVLQKKIYYIKMGQCNSIENTNLTYYQKNRDLLLNKAKDYYGNNKERVRVQARDKYRNLSEEEKKKTKRISKKLSRNKNI